MASASNSLRDRLAVLGQWIALGTLVGVLCGAASAAFLWLLERATERDPDNALATALAAWARVQLAPPSLP